MELNGKRVAIVMMSAIGDAVHVLPVVNSLKAAAPNVHITWIIQPGPHGLVRDHPAVDEFIVFDRRRGWRGFADLYRRTRGEHYDLVLALQVYFKAGLIAAMLSSPRKLGFDRARARDANWLFTTERIRPTGQRHVQDQYFEFLEHLGISPVLAWGLGPSEDEKRRYLDLLPETDSPTVAIVVGTSKPEKEWPADRYAKLVDRLYAEVGARCVLVGGKSPRELATAASIVRQSTHSPLSLLEWDLRRLVYLLDRADVLVTPDTGPLHIGVALAVPTVALLGYTNPKRVGPYGRFQDLMVDAYGESGEQYQVSAEYRHGRMERIGVDEVAEKVRLALNRYPRRQVSGQPSP